MICTEFYEGQGLGNQLACYITTRVIALDKGYDFAIKSPERFKGSAFLDLFFGEKLVGGKNNGGEWPQKLPDGIRNYYLERKITHPETSADISLYDKNLADILDSTKIDGIMQDQKYFAHRKEEIRTWLEIKKEHDCYDYSDPNTCIINFRGGEYTRHKDLFLEKSYWENAVRNMLEINKALRFVVITDDVRSAKKFFPDYDVFHFSIAKDYSIIKNAYYLILSNSSFAFFPAWLNTHLKFCIAPKYWARHNVSDGYWSTGQNLTEGWIYQDRSGKLFNYDACINELNEYMRSHADYFAPPKIKNNFLVVSNYNNDIRWVAEYTDNYVIYDRSENMLVPPGIDQTKIIKSPNVGYNSYDYCRFIVDNYDALPECTIFAKGWSFPRHVRREYFERIMNNNYFTPIEDWKMHHPTFPTSFFSPEGGFCEKNNSWYLNHWKTKYFKNYNNFLRFVYKDPLIPLYTRFAPGGDYIVPKANILKLPKAVYQNLLLFMSHCQEPGETHMIERAMHTLWTSNFELNPKILKVLPKDFIPSEEDTRTSLKQRTPVFIKKIAKKVIQKVRSFI